jgi:hypothetical protein
MNQNTLFRIYLILAFLVPFIVAVIAMYPGTSH